MSYYPHATRTVLVLLVILALVTGHCHAVWLHVGNDFAQGFNVPGDRAARHCYALHGHARVDPARGQFVWHYPVSHRVSFAIQELEMLVGFMDTVDENDVESAGMWAVESLRPDEPGQIHQLLAAAKDLKMYALIVAIGIYVPLPATGQPVLSLGRGIVDSRHVGPTLETITDNWIQLPLTSRRAVTCTWSGIDDVVSRWQQASDASA